MRLLLALLCETYAYNFYVSPFCPAAGVTDADVLKLEGQELHFPPLFLDSAARFETSVRTEEIAVFLLLTATTAFYFA